MADDEQVSSAAFQIAYDGPAMAGNSMDVQQLGPALLAIGDLCREASVAINGPHATEVNVLVRANFDEGCFDITFDLVQVVKEIFSIIKTPEAADAKTLLEWIGLIGTGSTVAGYSLFALLKWKKGRKFKATKNSEGTPEPAYTVTVKGNENTISISAPVYHLATSQRVLLAQRGLVSPLRQEGIDYVDIRENGKTITRFTKKEYQDGVFDLVDDEIAEEEPLEPQEFNCVLVIRGPVFAERVKWQFWLGKQRITAALGDELFIRRVFSGAERFGVGDRLHVRIRLTQVLTSAGEYRSDYEIILVTKIDPGPRQLAFLEDSVEDSDDNTA